MHVLAHQNLFVQPGILVLGKDAQQVDDLVGLLAERKGYALEHQLPAAGHALVLEDVVHHRQQMVRRVCGV